MNPYKTQIRNGTTFYQCEKCEIMGNVEETISKGFCHQRTTASHNREGKIEKKKRPIFKTQIPVKKFNSYLKLKERSN